MDSMNELINYQIPTPIVELIVLVIGYAWLFTFISWMNTRDHETKERKGARKKQG